MENLLLKSSLLLVSNPRAPLLTVDLEPEGQSRCLSKDRRLLDTSRVCTIEFEPSHQSKAYRLRDVVNIANTRGL